MALYECADLNQDRAMAMKAYADEVLDLNIGDPGCVRQKGGMSSFHANVSPLSATPARRAAG